MPPPVVAILERAAAAAPTSATRRSCARSRRVSRWSARRSRFVTFVETGSSLAPARTSSRPQPAATSPMRSSRRSNRSRPSRWSSTAQAGSGRSSLLRLALDRLGRRGWVVIEATPEQVGGRTDLRQPAGWPPAAPGELDRRTTRRVADPEPRERPDVVASLGRPAQLRRPTGAAPRGGAPGGARRAVGGRVPGALARVVGAGADRPSGRGAGPRRGRPPARRATPPSSERPSAVASRSSPATTWCGRRSSSPARCSRTCRCPDRWRVCSPRRSRAPRRRDGVAVVQREPISSPVSPRSPACRAGSSTTRSVSTLARCTSASRRACSDSRRRSTPSSSGSPS